MRNLKRVLSLALALVMVLGMMVITTSAAKLTDAEEITYTEAVDVISAIGVITGYPDGSFQPKGTLTREQGAAFVCYMLMGKTAADKLVGSGNFTDVAADRWSAGEIDYCANLGLIKGVGDNKFNPEGELTAVMFGRMLLGALGYDGDVEGYTGANWASSIAADMIDAGLDVKNVAMDKVLTREEAAQMAFQALKADMVEYATKGTSITVNGMNIVTGASKAEAVTSDDVAFDTIYDESDDVAAGVVTDDAPDATDPDVVQFAEEYYDKLYLETGAGDDADAYGRPAHSWYYGSRAAKDKVGVYADTAAATVLVTGMKNNTIAKVAEELGFDANGHDESINVGDVVEIYTNRDDEIIDVVVLEQKLGKISKVTETTEKDAKYTYTVSVTTSAGVTHYKDTVLVGFDAETMVKDTYVTIIQGTGTAIVALADKATGLKTAYGEDYIKIDGEKYEYGGNLWGAQNQETDGTAIDYVSTYDVYTDANGYVIGVVLAEEAKEATKIFFVNDADIEMKSALLGGATAKLAVTYLDGTSEVVNMAISKKNEVVINGTDTALDAEGTIKGFYAYTLNADGDIKSITAVDTNYGDAAAVEGFTVLPDTGGVRFAEEEANVVWRGNNWYATETTTLTTIKTGVPTKTITGYKNFAGKTFNADYNNGVYALAQYDRNNLKAVWVIGDTMSAVAEEAIYGWYVETGDTYLDAQKNTVTDVVYNVNGVDTTYTISGDTLASANEALVSIVVTDGIATLTPVTATADKVFDKVTDTYVVVNGNTKAVYLDSAVAVYDVTNVAKNGVVALEEIPTDAVVTYTTNTKPTPEINAVYVTYAAQEDGALAKNDATYIQTVLGFGSTDAANAAARGSDWIVIQYTRPADTAKNELTVKNAAGTVVYHESNTNTTPGTKGFMLDPNGTNVGDTAVDATNAGITLALTVGDTYTFTVECDDVVVCAGSFVVE